MRNGGMWIAVLVEPCHSWPCKRCTPGSTRIPVSEQRPRASLIRTVLDPPPAKRRSITLIERNTDTTSSSDGIDFVVITSTEQYEGGRGLQGHRSRGLDVVLHMKAIPLFIFGPETNFSDEHFTQDYKVQQFTL